LKKVDILAQPSIARHAASVSGGHRRDWNGRKYEVAA